MNLPQKELKDIKENKLWIQPVKFSWLIKQKFLMDAIDWIYSQGWDLPLIKAEFCPIGEC